MSEFLYGYTKIGNYRGAEFFYAFLCFLNLAAQTHGYLGHQQTFSALKFDIGLALETIVLFCPIKIVEEEIAIVEKR